MKKLSIIITVMLAAFALTAALAPPTVSAAMSDLEFVKLCEKGTQDQIKAAIKDGANVNARVGDDFTPLMAAAEKNSDPMVLSALIDAGADVNAQLKDGWEDENSRPRRDTHPQLRETWTAYMIAACYNPNPQVITVLARAGANVNTSDKNGWTALMAAGEHNTNPEVITAMAKAGSNVNATTLWGTPLMAAAAVNPDPQIITALIKAGANVNAENKNGRTALMSAARDNSKPEIISTLIKAGANVNTKKNDGMTALMLAASGNSNPDVISALIKAGADVGATDKNSWSALMWAAKNNTKPEIITTLIKAGANDVDWALLAAAQHSTNPAIITTLLNAGANPTKVHFNNDNKRAIDYAEQNDALKGTEALRRLRTAASANNGSAAVSNQKHIKIQGKTLTTLHVQNLTVSGLTDYKTRCNIVIYDSDCVIENNTVKFKFVARTSDKSYAYERYGSYAKHYVGTEGLVKFYDANGKTLANLWFPFTGVGYDEEIDSTLDKEVISKISKARFYQLSFSMIDGYNYGGNPGYPTAY